MSVTPSSPPATPEALRPVSATERVALLDVLRGVALYGVLLANTIPWYSGRQFLPSTETAARPGSIDGIALLLVRIFVDGKSLTLLSFLFGLGFAVQLMRAEGRAQDGVPVYLRRLAILMVIGLCHVIFLWWGDIVMSYAVTGFGLILFRRRTDRALLLWAAALLLVPRLLVTVPAVSELLDRIIPHQRHDDNVFKAQILAALTGNDRVHLMRMQVRQHLAHVAPIAVWYFPWTLGRFLLGYFVGRRRLLHDAAAHLPLFRKLLAWGAGLGLALNIAISVARFVRGPRGTLPFGLKLALVVSDEIGTLAMAAAYLSALTLLMQRPAWHRCLRIVAPVGQMALTNYLSQSLICTFLFYGWGLGLIGHVGPALCIPLTLAIFAAQILVSRWWLERFRFGPLEWLWRSLTYGRAQPMRRAEPAAHGVAL